MFVPGSNRTGIDQGRSPLCVLFGSESKRSQVELLGITARFAASLPVENISAM